MMKNRFRNMSLDALKKEVKELKSKYAENKEDKELKEALDLAKTELDKKKKKKAKEDEVAARRKEREERQKKHEKLIQDRQQEYSNYTLDKNGMPEKTANNVLRYFESIDRYRKGLRFNEFSKELEFEGEPFTDMLISNITMDVEKNMKINNKQFINDALNVICGNNTYHPIKEKIEKLEWDGVERAETFFIDYIGVEDTPLNRSMTKKWFYAMMKRLYVAGCPFDNMLIVYDENQGTGKTKIMQRLLDSVGLGDTYCTVPLNLNKDHVEIVTLMNSSWVVGIDELDSFLKATPEQAKTLLSGQHDKVRMKYDKYKSDFKRHYVFYGNTNIEYFLKDYSGKDERRYWVMDAHGTQHSAAWWDEKLPYSTCRLILAEIYQHYINNPDFPYADLSEEEKEMLAVVQERHKTYQNDVVLQYHLDKILNSLYERVNFANPEDFINGIQYNTFSISSKNGYVRTVQELLENADAADKPNDLLDFGEGFKNDKKDKISNHVINRIPASFVIEYLQKITKRNGISPKYVYAIINKEWDYSRQNYDGHNLSCYNRRKKIK